MFRVGSHPWIRSANRLVAKLGAILVVAAGLASGGEPATGAPVINATSTDRIGGFDFLIDDDGTRHAVWTVDPSGAVGGEERRGAWYARNEGRAAAWTTPLRLDDRADGSARIARLRDRLAVAISGTSYVFGSRDGGLSWTKAVHGLSLPANFSVIPRGTGLVVAMVVGPTKLAYHPHERSPADQIRIVVARIEDGRAEQRIVGELPSTIFDSPPPVLVADGARLHLIALVNGERRTRAGAVAVAPAVVGFSSEDDGRTWLPWSANAHPIIDVSTAVSAIDAVPVTDRLHIVLAATALLAMEGRVEAPWGPVRRVPESAAPTADLRGVSSCAAVGFADRIVLAWIDGRNRRGGHPWWNPLGGFPWSDDDPWWANNDAFVARIAPDQHADVRAPAARRLTTDLSYAQTIRLRADHDCVVAGWAGRDRVGKTVVTYDRPPALFFAIADCAGAHAVSPRLRTRSPEEDA